jgi:hypothetical protein
MLKKHTFKRYIAIAAACGVLGASVGFFIPFAGDYVFPKISSAVSEARYNVEAKLQKK